MYTFESKTDLSFLNKVVLEKTHLNEDCKYFYLPLEWTNLRCMLSNWHCPSRFSVRFRILLRKDFRSSFEIPKVRFELGRFMTQKFEPFTV